MLELSKRMKMNASLVPADSYLADVGCDHAYVSIYLAKERRCQKITAMDINEGPLAIAKKNISRYGVEGIVSCRLSNGLEQLLPGEADTILIAGMGGMLICHILSEGRKILEKTDTLILQPQSDVEQVRKTLWQLGFCIAEEMFCKDAEKYYLSIRAVKGTEKKVYSDEECTYGRILPAKGDACYYEWLMKEREKAKDIIKSLGKQGSVHAERQKVSLKEKIEKIEKVLECYKGALKYEGNIRKKADSSSGRNISV